MDNTNNVENSIFVEDKRINIEVESNELVLDCKPQFYLGHSNEVKSRYDIIPDLLVYLIHLL